MPPYEVQCETAANSAVVKLVAGYLGSAALALGGSFVQSPAPPACLLYAPAMGFSVSSSKLIMFVLSFSHLIQSLTRRMDYRHQDNEHISKRQVLIITSIPLHSIQHRRPADPLCDSKSILFLPSISRRHPNNRNGILKPIILQKLRDGSLLL
jgi:hypothetical protein